MPTPRNHPPIGEPTGRKAPVLLLSVGFLLALNILLSKQAAANGAGRYKAFRKVSGHPFPMNQRSVMTKG